ncbi:unnamed protein product [Sphagnum troendelagicum]
MMMAHQPIAVAGNWNIWTLPWHLALHLGCPLMLVPVTAQRWIHVPAFVVLHLLGSRVSNDIAFHIDGDIVQCNHQKNGGSFHSIL